MGVARNGVVHAGGRDEEVAAGGEHGEKAMTGTGRAKFLHDTFAFSQRQTCVFRPVVQPLVAQMPS